MQDHWRGTVDRFVGTLRTNGLWRAYVITDARTGTVKASHPAIEDVARRVEEDTRDYHRHEGVFFEIGRESGHLLSAAIHWTHRGQAAGGVRFWTYDTMEQMVRDGLRLSRGMGHKCALAGLWWGGGKGVVARRADRDHRDPGVRRAMYEDFGRFISGLRGCYVTAEDVGTTQADMVHVFRMTRHTTSIPERLGGSGNPSVLTASGVVVAMEAALHHLQLGTLEGKTVAMQGLGNVSFFMIGDLMKRRVGRIIGVDIESEPLKAIREAYPGAPLELRTVNADDVSIFGERCDVLAPNAVGATLNPGTIPHIRARVVCGAANNQLEDAPRDAALLRDRGILYVPDFLANRMGIVNCANEQYGAFPGDPVIAAHLERDHPTGVFQRSLDVFARAEKSGRTTADEALSLADELSLEPHPIWADRSRQIIAHLVESGWSDDEPIA
jgi:glutamate dehydrogenase/leucine dehydrogenase